MPLPPSRNRFIAISAIGLLVLGGAFAGLAFRGGIRPATATAGSLATSAAVAQATSLSDAFIAIAETVTPAVVRIEVERTIWTRQPPPLSGRLQDLFNRAEKRPAEQPEQQLGGGSGFIVSPDGYILTNNHVIAGADRITVILRDKRAFEARIVGTDPSTDVAVIKIEAQNLTAAVMGDSDAARVGEWVMAIGNPGFDAGTLDFTVTSGIISAKNRPLDVLHTELHEGETGTSIEIEDFIQTDAVINPGNSGGPLVDLRGTVVGINSAIASTTGYNQGYGFAIPSNLAQRVMKDLIAHGYVRRALLGVSIIDVTAEDAEVYKLPSIAGVVVEDFSEGSPAERSGLQRHDVIIAVDGRPVGRISELQRVIALHEPGETVPLTVLRYGERRELRVRLMGVAGPAAAKDAKRATATPGLGIEVEELTQTLAGQLGFERPGGAVIARVLPGSPAHRKDVYAQYRIAAIDGKAINTAAEARRGLSAPRSGQVVSILMESADGRTYIANVRMP